MKAPSKFLPFFEPSWGSVIRIGLWCLLFLWLFGKLVPPFPEKVPLQNAQKTSPVVPMLTIFDDHRTVREDYKPDPNKLHIAWVSDSSGMIVPDNVMLSNMGQQEYETIPGRVGVELKKRHKMPDFDIPLYLRLGSRPVDNLIFSLQALKQKPDLIVIPVNHVWTFSHYQIINKNTSLNLAPEVWAGFPSLWYMIPLFCSPIENLWALLGNHLDIIRDALPFKDHLEQQYEGLLTALGIYAGPAPIVLGVPLLNIKFWIVMNILHGDASKVLDDSGALNAQLYDVQIISHNTPYDNSSFALTAFHDMLDVLKATGIPVLVYEHPISDYYYQDPDTNWKIKETQAFLASADESLKGSRVHIVRTPEAVRKTITFRKNDGYHAGKDPVKFDDFLADQIWLMLKGNGKLPPQGGKTP
jgi:hypothetical protein